MRQIKSLTKKEWEDVENRMTNGARWAEIADYYGLKASSLAVAGRRRGIRSKSLRNHGERPRDVKPFRNPEPVIPAAVMKNDPDVRQTLLELVRRTKTSDPEPVLAAVRDRLAAIADVFVRKMFDQTNKKYEGLPELGYAAPKEFGKDLQNLFDWAPSEQIDPKDILKIYRQITELEAARMPYHKPRLAATQVKMDVSTDLQKLTDEELDAALEAAEAAEKVVSHQ